MLNQTHSKTSFFKKTLNIEFDLERLKGMSYKKDELYYTQDGELELKNEIIIKSKNIFSIYTDDAYDLYLEISKALKETCSLYQIDFDKQKYMIYGKIAEYGQATNRCWYDFPGINIPYLHGFYFPDGREYKVSFSNNNITKEETFDKNQLFINKPTDVINIKTQYECELIEFYIVPLISLKHNEPGVWVPIN
jgi:hypothetical protein